MNYRAWSHRGWLVDHMDVALVIGFEFEFDIGFKMSSFEFLGLEFSAIFNFFFFLKLEWELETTKLWAQKNVEDNCVMHYRRVI